METPRLLTAVYRALLRTTRTIDTIHPAVALLSARPRAPTHNTTHTVHHHIRTRTTLGQTSSAHDHLALDVADRALRRAFGSKDLYSGATAGRTVSLFSALRAEARALVLLDKAPPPDVVVDAGFALLRRLEAACALAESAIGPLRSLPRERPVLVGRASAPPAEGDVLLGHPMLRRDVILLLSVVDDFAMGLITNSPSQHTLGGSGGLRGGPSPAAHLAARDHEISCFAREPIFRGGPDGAANLTMLHRFAAVRGAVAVRDGLFYGGSLGDAARLVFDGVAKPSDFIFFRGRVDFQPGVLREQLERGELAHGVVRVPWPPVGSDVLGVHESTDRQEHQEGSPLHDPLERHRVESWAAVVSGLSEEEPAGESLPTSAALRDWLRLLPLADAELARLRGQAPPRSGSRRRGARWSP